MLKSAVGEKRTNGEREHCEAISENEETASTMRRDSLDGEPNKRRRQDNQCDQRLDKMTQEEIKSSRSRR